MPATISAAIVAGIGLTGTLTGALITAGLTAALTFAQQKLFGGNKGQSGSAIAAPLNEGTKQTVRQPVVFQRTIYGRATTGGAFTFFDKKAPDLFIQYAIAAHECDALESVFEQGVEVFFDSQGNATSTPYFDGVDVFLQISMRLGTDDQAADALLAANFPSLSSEFRHRGHTVATVRFFYGNDDDQHREKWGQEGNIHPKFRMRGKKIYDPRVASQAADDPDTWTWTDNAVLCIVDYLRSEDGGRKSSQDIDWVFVLAAADICDQQVARKDGTSEKRYTINAVVDTSADRTPVQNLVDMLSAMRGRLVWVNGKVRPIPGIAQKPVMTITQDMLAGPFDYRGDAPRDELVNVVTGKFVAPERENQAADAPVLERLDLIAIDGQRLEANLDHPFVEDHTRAQRLNTAFLKQSRLGRTLSVVTDMRALRATAGEVVDVEFTDFPYVNGTYFIEKVDFVDSFSKLSFTLTQTDASVYVYDPQTDEQPFVLQEAA